MTIGTVNQWYWFKQGLSDKEIKKIRKKAGSNWDGAVVDMKRGTTDEERKTGLIPDPGVDKKTRISDVIWINEQWLYDLIWPWMERANERAGWNYEIDAAEDMQITRYKPGGFYSWHSDGLHDHLSKHKCPDKPFVHDKVRKLSMTVLLNDNYEGGEFEFISYSKEETFIDAPMGKHKKGQIIVFPSTMEHRVRPVSKGIRYSAVVWFLGPPMR